MKWLISILIIAALAAGAWFLYPKLQLEPELSEAQFYPESTWLIFEVDNLSEFYQQLNDSSSIFRAIPTLNGAFENMVNFLKPASESKSPAKIILYGSPMNVKFNLITETGSSMAWPDGIVTAHSSKTFIAQSEATSKTMASADYNALLKRASAQSGSMKAIVKKEAFSILIASSISSKLLPFIEAEMQEFRWLGFDLSFAPNLAMASGIGTYGNDESNRQNASDLMRYVPAEAELVMILGDSISKCAIVSCAYDISMDSEDATIFLLTQKDRHEYAMKWISSRFATGWLNESPVSHDMGDVIITGSSESIVERFVNDYLSDHRLIGSAAFEPMASRVSDASFTLYIRNDASALHPSILKEMDASNRINSIVLQSYSELPGNKFFSINALHNLELVEALPTAWTNSLDASINAGPWLFKNHYSGEPEIIVSDVANQLYLINAEGKTLWKHQLESAIVGNVQMIDAFSSGKNQMLFATHTMLHLVDRNGNNVEGFPIKLEAEATAQPTAIKYTKDSDYRILVNEGNKLKNYATDGSVVKGWKSPEMGGPLQLPIEWFLFSGKDYLMATTTDGKVIGYDREGGIRMKAIKVPTKTSHAQLIKGESLSKSYVLGQDTAGNLVRCYLGGDCTLDNILPIDTNSALLFNPKSSCRFVCIAQNRVVGLDEKLNVVLDFTLPETITDHPAIAWPNKGWIRLSNDESGRVYILSPEGQLLSHMPAPGSSHSLITDIDQNGVMELITARDGNELVVYRLSY
ncbi:MAG: hypothetical protein R2813_01430 [Flavobacteriales bacterium]